MGRQWKPTKILLAFLVFFPGPALALQSHGPPEGLYVHQAAHICFFLAMVYLAFELTRGPLAVTRNLSLMVWASILFALWNLDAFLGHCAEAWLEPGALIGSAHQLSQRLILDSPSAWVYYLARFDHLLLLPALLLFYLGLKRLRRRPIGGQP